MVFEMERLHTIKFETIQAKGMSPCARSHHTMNLLHKKMTIAVVGGIDRNENVLADVWLFELLTYKWNQVQMEPSLELLTGGICKHSSVADGCSLYIYGGQHIVDQGIDNFIVLDFEKEMKDKKVKGEEVREPNKVSSFWSVSPTKGYIGSSVFHFDD